MLASLLLAAVASLPAQAPEESVELRAPLQAPAERGTERPPPQPDTVPPDRWFLQRYFQGTGLGLFNYDHRLAVSGWLEPGVNAGSAAHNNAPLILHDRANSFLYHQTWLRVERAVVTKGTLEPTWGFRLDALGGSDYRFSLPRGLWNSQLLNAENKQSYYGVDLIQHFVELNVPTVARGFNFRVGRWYTPFGSESVEAPTRPLYSLSYTAFAAPFTNVGGLATLTLSPRWTVQAAAVNGNSVWIDKSSEGRFVGTLKYTAPDQQDTVTFGTSVGRGSMNTGDPFAVPTFAGADEPAGRENINTFDLVWTHIVNPRLTLQVETLYGYQSAVPANVQGGIIDQRLAKGQPGTAHYGSIVGYAFVNWTPAVGSVLRVEFFDDFEGQQTGYEGLYSEVTAGVQFKLKRLPSGTPQLLFRPELRYDYNGYSRPFENRHGLFTAAADLVIRW